MSTAKSMRDLPVAGRTSHPSIFNDVIGPVMRGPSSSHCAAAVRIGRMARDLMGGDLTKVLVEFHPGGSLATTHQTQGSDMGLFGGLLGWEASHEDLRSSALALRKAGVQVEIRVRDFPATHPNTYRLTLWNASAVHRMTALSVGGGMIRVVEVDSVPLVMEGDYHETLLFIEPAMGGAAAPELATLADTLRSTLEAAGVTVEAIRLLGEADAHLVQIQTRVPIPQEIAADLRRRPWVAHVRTIAPVLPILSGRHVQVPFVTASALMEAADRPLWELAVQYESQRGGISEEEVLRRMSSLVELLETSLQQGLAGTEAENRILPQQVGRFRAAMDEGTLLGADGRAGGLLNRMVLYVTALMEAKSAMGVIIAAPTAGACGALPGACLALAHHRDASREDLAKAMLASGMIGVVIAARSTFAAEVCGCQAETGAGGGMAAAGLVSLAGGTTRQALSAASMALQNTLGLVCDPVANRVEVPCLGRNVLAAANALTSANMALAGFDAVIPLDEVVQAMDEVGRSLPSSLRCTALGGLSITPTSLRIQRELDGGD